MTRIAFLGSASLIFLSCAALPACGQQDETQAVLAQCSDPAPGDIDSCLERARVLDETSPSPEVQALIGRLIQRQARASEPPPPPPPGAAPDPDHPVDDKGVSSYDVSPPTPPPSSDLGPLEPYQPPPQQQDETPPDTQTAPADMGPPDPNAPPPGGTIIQTTPPQQGDGPEPPHH
jgi:hypothetical protein